MGLYNEKKTRNWIIRCDARHEDCEDRMVLLGVKDFFEDFVPLPKKVVKKSARRAGWVWKWIDGKKSLLCKSCNEKKKRAHYMAFRMQGHPHGRARFWAYGDEEP